MSAPRNDSGGSIIANSGTNGQQFYTRESVWHGDDRTGAYFSYGIRGGNDFRTGGKDDFTVPSSYKKWDVFAAVSHNLDNQQRLDFNYLRTEVNDLELPGVVYDINNLHNDQFNVRYVIQDDPNGPEWLVIQAWWAGTKYHGDSTSFGKHSSFYDFFFSAPADPTDPASALVNTFGNGRLENFGARWLSTIGEDGDVRITFGADWRRYRQRYQEVNFEADGDIAWEGNIYGIPQAQQDDFGLLTHMLLPWSDNVSSTLGGRIDLVQSTVNTGDRIITESNPIGSASTTNYRPGDTEPHHLLGMLYSTTSVHMSETFRMNGGMAFAMRPPSVAELYQDEPYEPAYRFGNSFTDGLSSIDPEKNVQLDLGFSGESGRWKFGGRGFYTYINDYIMAVPSQTSPGVPLGSETNVLGRDFSSFPAGFREDLNQGTPNADATSAGYQYANLDFVDIWGSDAFLEVQPEEWFSLRGMLSYVYATNHDPLQFIADPVTFDSRDGTFVSVGGSEPLPGIYPLNATITARVFQPTDDLWSIAFVTR
ncbi:MAG: TonB-dependent receptor, partial [Planctomycetes bacterium]|nr:TonB-dependent receptor [Planctomycetota bacterium]